MLDKPMMQYETDRVRSLLCLPPEIDSKHQIEAEVMKGLQVKSVDMIIGELAADHPILLISERAYRRAKDKKIALSPSNSRKLYDFARAYAAIETFYEGKKGSVLRFLENPNTNFDGKTPLTLAISSPAGADAVIELLRPAVTDVDMVDMATSD
jgi:uncharacterized protein (DUF2384 family)